MRSSLPVALLLLLSCGSTTEPEPSAHTYHVLFVGNSLTYVNDLPAMVTAIGMAGGDTIVTKTLAFPDWGLQDHWEQGTAPEEIATGEWDLVVMQQGPSSLEASRIDLLNWAHKFGDLAHLHHTCPAFYMVWPALANIGGFDAVYDHYKEAADSNAGLFLPAGQAWRDAWAHDPDLALYGPDSFHPSPMGSYLAALTIYAGITGRTPVGNTANLDGVYLSGPIRTILQQAAAEAVHGIPRRCAVR